MVGIAVATIELSTAAMNVAIRQAASTSVRRAEGACATWIGGGLRAGTPRRARSGLVMVWTLRRFCHRGRAAGNLHDRSPAVLSRHRTIPEADSSSHAQPCTSGRYRRRYRRHLHRHRLPPRRRTDAHAEDPHHARRSQRGGAERHHPSGARPRRGRARHRALPAWHDDRHQCGAGAQGREDRPDRQRGVPRHPGDRLPAPPGPAPHHAGAGHAGVPGTRRATQGGARAGLRAGRGDRAAGRGLGAARRGGTGGRRRAGDRGVLPVLLPASGSTSSARAS